MLFNVAEPTVDIEWVTVIYLGMYSSTHFFRMDVTLYLEIKEYFR